MKARFNYIDWLKGIAIISVVMGHIVQYDFLSLNIANKSFLDRFIYSIHMPLFIFLSGLVVNYRFDSISNCCKKILSKARVLLIPAFFIGVPYTLWRGYTLSSFFLDSMKYGYWYLITLFEFYVIYYILCSFFSKSIYVDLVKGCAIWIICKYISSLEIDANIFSVIQLSQIIHFWPFFFAAATINKYKIQDKLFSNNNIFTVSLLVFIVMFLYKEYYTINKLTIMFLLQFAGIFCIIYLIFKIKDKNNTVLNILNFIGRNSLDIYLFHYFFIHVGYMKIVGNYFLEYPNFIMETIVTLVYALIIVYCSIYTGKLLRESKVISKVLFNK